jgi:hypothetical protein
VRETMLALASATICATVSVSIDTSRDAPHAIV